MPLLNLLRRSCCINSCWEEINSPSGELEAALNSGKMGWSWLFKITDNPSWSFVYSHMQEFHIFRFLLRERQLNQVTNKRYWLRRHKIYHLSHWRHLENFPYTEHQHETSPPHASALIVSLSIYTANNYFFPGVHNSSLTDCSRLTHGFNLGASISFINGFFFSFKWWFLFGFACNVCKMIWDAFCTCVQ